MKTWWEGRTSQEQLALILGSAAVCLLLIYLFIWLPFEKRASNQALQVESQRSTLAWMQDSAEKIQTLKSQQSGNRGASGNQALLTLVDKTAKQQRLRSYIKRLKPEGNDSVQLWMEETPFDPLIKWLGTLESNHGVRVESLNIDREEKSGVVQARFNLTRGAG